MPECLRCDAHVCSSEYVLYVSVCVYFEISLRVCVRVCVRRYVYDLYKIFLSARISIN